MSLAETLNEIAKASAEKFPESAQAIMERDTNALITEDAATRAVQVGGRAPELELPGPEGVFSLRQALESGPAVVTWFRGNW